MPLGLREVLVVLRAKDQASRVIAGVGQSIGSLERSGRLTAGQMMNLSTALVGAGVAIGAVGVAGIGFFNSATNAAQDYQKQVALTFTQVDRGKASFDQLRTIGLDIAKRFPVEFEQVQQTLFDIFSSMDVNAKEAKRLLTNFAVAATAGQVDIQSAGRATIAIMNAFKIPISDVNKVIDVQFQIVRKGVISYEEFASTIGRSIPSAARAGQSIEVLGGMIAFLTRNGLNAAMASTSAARALDAMANPKVIDRIEAMGVKVKNSAGEFLPLDQILGQVNKKFAGLTKPELAEKLQDLFKGAGGTIQARRFFDLVFKNFDQFQARVEEMRHAGGAGLEAFGEMFGTAALQQQILTNQFKAARIEIGEQLLPIKLQLIRVLLRLLKSWNSLDTGTRKTIVTWVAVASVIFTVVGAAIALAGAFGIVIASIMFITGGTVVAAIGILAGIAAAMVALVAVGYLVYRNWSTIKEFAADVWPKVKEFATNAADEIKERWDDFVEDLKNIWKSIREPAIKTWNQVRDAVVHIVRDLANKITKANFTKGLMSAFNNIRDFVNDVWPDIQKIISTVLKIIMADIRVVVAIITTIWNHFGDNIFRFIKTTWDAIVEIFSAALQVVKGIIQVFTAILTGDWSKAWEGVKNIVLGTWDAIVAFMRAILRQIGNIVGTIVEAIVAPFRWLYDTLIGNSIIPDLINGIVDWFKRLPIMLLAALADAINWLVQTGINVVTGLLNSIVQAAAQVWNWFKNLPVAIAGLVVGAGNWLLETGVKIINGMWGGMKAMISQVWDWVTSFPRTLGSLLGDAGNWLFDIGKRIIQGLWNGMKSVWRSTEGWLGGLGGLIPMIKGPPAKDKILLEPTGKMIMQGLQTGMQKQWDAVAAFLRAVNVAMINSGLEWMNALAKGIKQGEAFVEAAIRHLNLGNALQGTFKVEARKKTQSIAQGIMQDLARPILEAQQAAEKQRIQDYLIHKFGDDLLKLVSKGQMPLWTALYKIQQRIAEAVKLQERQAKAQEVIEKINARKAAEAKRAAERARQAQIAAIRQGTFELDMRRAASFAEKSGFGFRFAGAAILPGNKIQGQVASGRGQRIEIADGAIRVDIHGSADADKVKEAMSEAIDQLLQNLAQSLEAD